MPCPSGYECVHNSKRPCATGFWSNISGIHLTHSHSTLFIERNLLFNNSELLFQKLSPHFLFHTLIFSPHHAKAFLQSKNVVSVLHFFTTGPTTACIECGGGHLCSTENDEPSRLSCDPGYWTPGTLSFFCFVRHTPVRTNIHHTLHLVLSVVHTMLGFAQAFSTLIYLREHSLITFCYQNHACNRTSPLSRQSTQ